MRLQFATILCVSLASVPSLRAADVDPYEAELQKRSVSPTVAGIRAYLNQLTPSEAQKKRAVALVARLGAAEYGVRESAGKQLAALPHPPIAALQMSAKSNDPEVRWRASIILRWHSDRGTPMLHAILVVISRKKLRGLTAEVLSAVPHLDDRFGRRLAENALKATATKRDAAMLRAALQHADSHVRAAAVVSLSAVIGDAALNDLRPLLKNTTGNEAAQFAAARAFAEAGKREALTPLVELLDAEDIDLRTRAAQTLMAFTGKRFGFASYDSAKGRQASVARWKHWLAATGKTAALKHPLAFLTGYESYLNGNLLLSFGYRNKVVEYNPAGKEIWSFNATGAYGAEKLANGNVLIACYAQKEVLEVSPAKKIVWRFKVPSSLNARPLPNGNILIACHTAKEVWEVTRNKKVIWKYTHTGNCYDAHRLPNGNTMISSNTSIIEVDRTGKKVWELANGGTIYGFQPLPNGNILVAAFSKQMVAEYTRKNQIVWKHNISSPFDAFRLPNGHTLITASSTFLEIDAKGKTLWTRTGNSYGRARK